MTRTILLTLGLLVLAGGAVAQNDDAVDVRKMREAEARALLDEAEMLAKSHRLAETEALLRRVLLLAPESRAALEAHLLAAEILMRQGSLEKARELLEKAGERWKAHPDLGEKAEHVAHVIEATLEARELRAAAIEARMEAHEAEARAAVAEAKARLLQEDVPLDEIERHKKEIIARFRADRLVMEGKLEAVRDYDRLRLDVKHGASLPLWELLRARGMPSEKAYEEAERRVREIEEARRQIEESQVRLEELDRERARAGGDPTSKWKIAYVEAEQRYRVARKRIEEFEKTRLKTGSDAFAHAEQEIEETRRRIEENRTRLRELKLYLAAVGGEPHPEIRKRMEEAKQRIADGERRLAEFEAARAAHPRPESPGHRPGDDDARPTRRLEERVERIERRLEEMRERLERVLRDR